MEKQSHRCFECVYFLILTVENNGQYCHGFLGKRFSTITVNTKLKRQVLILRFPCPWLPFVLPVLACHR
jgi:hypothetical protein